MLSFPDFEQKRIVVVFATEGQKFAVQNDNLIVKDQDEKIILQDTCFKILSLWTIGNCSVTSVLLKKSKKYGFPIFHLQQNFKTIGVWNAPTEGNFLLRHKQYHFENKELAKKLVENKMNNQHALLKNLRDKSVAEKDAIAQLENQIENLQHQNEWKSILGIEGNASKIFFNIYFQNMDWKGRKPRAKTDPLNVLLDMGYTFLFFWIENMLNLYGFDVYKGVYHQPFYQRKSLVCDVVEPFRCIIDHALRKAWNLGQIKTEDFILQKHQYLLKHDKQKEYTAWLLRAILDHKNEIYYYCRDYYRAFIREKKIEDYPFFKIN